LRLEDVREQSDGSFVASYRVEHDGTDDIRRAKWLVMIRAESQSIVSADQPPLLLDADFDGTRLKKSERERIWKIDQEVLPRDVLGRLVDTGRALPSGNGDEGGAFHATFSIDVD
jgi:hypothetical protein